MAASFNQQKSIEKQTTDTAETVPENHSSKSNSSPSTRQKRSLFSYGPSLVQANLHAHTSVRESSNLKVRARPFDEFVLTPVGDDSQTSIPIKTDGNSKP